MIGSFADDSLPWVWLAVALFGVIGGLYGFTRWARSQFRDAVFQDIKPMLDEIGLSVNNVSPNAPKLIERVTAAAMNAELAKSMAEANGSKIEELSRRVSTLSADVQLALGTTGIAKDDK